MKVVGVIPARYGSTRFPGKPLVNILGRPLVQWVYEAAQNSRSISELVVATDNQEIFDCVESFGGRAVMTDSGLPTGTDRAWAAAEGLDADVIVNIQGDEPLISGGLLDQLVAPFAQDAGIEMATLGRPLKEGDLESPNTAKIVCNRAGEAMYFSRFPIPYSRHDAAEFPAGCLKHIGLYAYRKGFLQKFCQQPPVAVEQAEGLEQLRALYLQARISVVEVDHESWGVDHPEDVKKIEALMQAREAKG